MTSLAFSSTAMETGPSSSGVQDFHDAIEGTTTNSSDDAIFVESVHKLSDPASEITVTVCEQCMDSLLITVTNDDGGEAKHWCVECHDGRCAKHEQEEKQAAKDAIVIDSSGDECISGGGLRNSECVDNTSKRRSKVSHDMRPQGDDIHSGNPFFSTFGLPDDSLGNKRPLSTTDEKFDRHDTDEEASGVSTDRLSANYATAFVDSRRGNNRRPSPNTKAKIEKPETTKPGSKVQTKTKMSRSESPVVKGGTRPPRPGSLSRAGSITRDIDTRPSDKDMKRSPDISDEESDIDYEKKAKCMKQEKDSKTKRVYHEGMGRRVKR